MPTVRVETNLSADFFPNDFMPLFLIFLAELLGKDKNVMKFVFDTDKNMTIVSTINQKYLNFELAQSICKDTVVLFFTFFRNI